MGVRRRGTHRSRKSTGDQTEEGSAPPAPQPHHRPSRSSLGFKPSLEEVLAAIGTLYDDQLKPFGRILRKRIAERAVEDGKACLKKKVVKLAVLGQTAAGEEEPSEGNTFETLPDVDVKHLRTICDEAEEVLKIQPEEGGDWSAVRRDRTADFVDIYSTEDPFSAEVWEDAAKYFQSITGDEALLPGGRYSCAQALLRRPVPFLRGFTLGKVCHLVQLAIAQHKILGYCNGAVVPYAMSQSMVKEQCAAGQQPCAGPDQATGAAVPSATWEVARACLRAILKGAADPTSAEPAALPLSNIKRLFRAQYNIELSETALGHAKLSDLLQDSRFSDICTVQLLGQGYTVIQTQGPAQEGLLETLPFNPLAQEGDDEEEDAEPCQQSKQFCPDEPLDLLDFDDLGPLPGEPSSMPVMSTPMASPGAPSPATALRWGWPLGYPNWQPPMFKAGFPDSESAFLDQLQRTSDGSAIFTPFNGSGECNNEEETEEAVHRQTFCQDEPLDLEAADDLGPLLTGELSGAHHMSTPLPSPGAPSPATALRWGWPSSAAQPVWPQHLKVNQDLADLATRWASTGSDNGDGRSTTSQSGASCTASTRGGQPVECPEATAGESQNADSVVTEETSGRPQVVSHCVLTLLAQEFGTSDDEDDDDELPSSRGFCPNEPLIVLDSLDVEDGPLSRETCSTAPDIADVATTPAYLPPPTPNSPFYCPADFENAFKYLEAADVHNRVLRLSDHL